MSGRIDQGGFVFSTVCQDDNCPNGQRVHLGITRRDWLAGLAMAGIMGSSQSSKDAMHPTTALEVARSAYHLADLMIRVSKEMPAEYESSPEMELAARLVGTV